MRISRWLLPVLAVVAGLAAGCAQQVGDIDRTSPYALSKADFTDGEWYIRQTFVEVPPASFAGFVGLTSSMEKIRWEITEDYLIAYRSYENNPGSRGEIITNADGTIEYVEGEEEGFSDEFKESAIAAYPISSHFDIQRGYSSSTGEQTNVISENTSDRNWWEQEYFRINWSNALDNATLWGDGTMFSGLSWYVPENEASRDAFRIEHFNPSNVRYPGMTRDSYPAGSAFYLDFTTRMLVDYTSYCMGWYPDAPFDCGSSEVEVLTSILRVPEVSEYEPTIHDDLDQQKFGYFRTERIVWDERFGSRLSGQILLSNRHNIWSNTWQRDGNGNVITDAEGRALANPMAERTPEPVVYHLSLGYPEELMPATDGIEAEWDRAFRRAAAGAQGIDLEAFDQQMFIVCNNPVVQEDPEECGAVGLEARAGDLRFNFIYWVDNNQMSGPLGYGPSNPDPETGEIIAGQAFVYGSAVDTYSQYGLDLIRFLNGDLTIDGLRDADYVRDELMTRINPTVDPRAMTAIDPSLADINLEDIQLREMIPQSANNFIDYVEVNGMNDFSARPEQTRQRFEMIEESGLGALAVDDEVMGAIRAEFGVENMNDLPADITEMMFSNGSFLLPQLNDAYEARVAELARNNIMMADQLDDTIIGLAMQYRGRNDYDVIWNELRNKIYEGVMEHEVGHTVGLRHNFQGSYDSINYFDEYWELRTEGMIGVNDGGQIDVVPFRRPENLAEIFGVAQMTPAQVEGRMREYQYSTIMDYHSQFNMDNSGIGRYDEAAIIYAYSAGRDSTVSDQYDSNHPLYNTQERGLVEVFDNVGDARTIFENYEGLDSPAYTDLLEQIHYTTLATQMATTGGNYPADPNEAAALIRQRLSERSLQRYQEVLNQREVENAGRPIEVPYLFLSDLWNGARQSARAWDQGADPLEQSLNIIERYRTYYPFLYFRRDRADWSQFDVFNRLASRYYGNMIDNYQRWLFNVAIRESADDVLANGWTFGAFASLNLFSEVLTTPSYGSYALNEDEDIYQLTSYSERSNAELYIPPGQGRRQFSQYDADMGYNYWVWPTEGGHFWGQYAATIILSASTSVSVRGADTGADFLTYSVPPYLVFQEEMTTLYNSLFLEDAGAIAPRAVRSEDGKFDLVSRLFAPIALNDGSIMNPETGATVDAADVYTPGDEIDAGDTVDIFYSFSQRYLPVMYGFAFFTSNNSLNYPDQGKIFRTGSGETVTPGEGFEVVEVCDPTSAGGECYAALSCIVVDEVTDETPGCLAEDYAEPLAVAMIRRAQDAIDSGQAGYAVANEFEMMNLLRGMYDIFGSNF